MADPLVSLHGISKVFEETGTRIELFRDLDFAIAPGDFISIMGASGVGKSTLLHILGLLDHPTSGRVRFRGKDVSGISDRALSGIRGKEIGFVFQFHHLLPDLTVKENVLMPARIAGGLRRADEEHALELIRLVGMDHRLRHLPNELSGGERQRVALARALINRPGLLLCDEPSGNLDAKNSGLLHAQLIDLNRRLDVAILVVTHDRGLAGLAGRNYVMEGGGLRAQHLVPAAPKAPPEG
ncbi:MAG TPA: ABC transporter ATP-binding protein [Fibrobacteria bacterium]|nr:ABC transporter ATP-binding protein [Fibrobacteria bacterium]